MQIQPTGTKEKLKPRGRHVIVSDEEKQRIIQLKQTMSVRKVCDIVKRSVAVVVYADKEKPETISFF